MVREHIFPHGTIIDHFNHHHISIISCQNEIVQNEHGRNEKVHYENIPNM